MSVLRRFLLCVTATLVLGASGCEAEEGEVGLGGGIAIPSGRSISLQDVITNAQGVEGATARFRFVLPDLKAGEDLASEMQFLCDTYAVKRIDAMVPKPNQIVISFADSETPFGEATPDVVQFFEAYRVENAACIWEMF